MLLVHPVRELSKTIPALVGLVLVGRAMGDGQQWWLAPLGVVVVIAVSVLRWLTTRYRITAEQVHPRTGLRQRKAISTPADRVRTVRDRLGATSAAEARDGGYRHPESRA